MKSFERLKALLELTQPHLRDALLLDENDIVRHEAAFLLGQQFPSIEDTEQALTEAVVNDLSVLVRHEACLALAKFKTETAFDTLAECLMDSSPEVRSSAKYALKEMMFSTKEL